MKRGWETFAFALRYCWVMSSWRLWRYLGDLVRFYRYVAIEGEMERLDMPASEREVLQAMWLYGRGDGSELYVECERCYMRYDPEYKIADLDPHLQCTPRHCSTCVQALAKGAPARIEDEVDHRGTG